MRIKKCNFIESIRYYKAGGYKIIIPLSPNMIDKIVNKFEDMTIWTTYYYCFATDGVARHFSQSNWNCEYKSGKWTE
jgi:hypothetical protein